MIQDPRFAIRQLWRAPGFAAVIAGTLAKDGWLLVGLTSALGLFGVAASLLPARRAAGIDPMQALRAE